MNKILLVYEDYPELMNVEAALKKIGFDVIGITHEYSIMEQVISFKPDVVVGCGKGGKVSSLGVGKRLKEMGRWSGKTILIFSANNKPAGPDLLKIRSDIMLEAPVQPLRLIQVLAKLLGHDEAMLQERLNKMIHSESGTAKPAGPGFSTAKDPSKNENVKFVVGGNAAADTDKTIIGGMNFNRAAENEEAGSSSGGERGSSLFTGLKGRQDLYQNEVKGKAEVGENLFAEVDLKSLERELSGEPEPTASSSASKPEATTAKTGSSTGADPETSPKKETSGTVTTAPEAIEVSGVPEVAKVAGVSGIFGQVALAETAESVSGKISAEASVPVAGKTASEMAFDELVSSASAEKAKAEKDPHFWAAEKSPESDAVVSHQKDELEKAQASVHDRVAKYSEYLKAAPQASKEVATQLTRTEARKRQRELVKDWDAEKLKDLDKLRREFTKALYKK